MKGERKSEAQPRISDETRIAARPVSRGVAYGPVICLYGRKRQFFRVEISPNRVETEVKRFRKAANRASKELRRLAALGKKANPQATGVFDTHLLILENSSFAANIEAEIRTKKINADWAVKTISETYLSRQRAIADEHLREKYIDLEDISERVMAALDSSVGHFNANVSGSIIVAREIWPSTLAEITQQNPVALITENGGWTSHASILARSFGLPAVSGVENIFQRLATGDMVVVDANSVK